MSEEPRKVEGKDKDGNDVVVYVKKPTTSEYRDSQIEYNKAFRSALEGGALLKKRLGDYMKEQGIWDEDKDTEEKKLLRSINDQEGVLEKGGIPLSEAKERALELRVTRNKFRNLIAERTMLDSNTVEGQADNARFNFLVSACMLNEECAPLFKSLEEYDKASDEPWAAKAAGELAGMIYELDPDYDKNLVENKFLVDYEFADEDLRLVNKAGHPIDLDDDGTERLVDKEGRFIAYRTKQAEKVQNEEKSYYVNREGIEVDKDGKVVDGFSPFLDARGKPVPEPVSPEPAPEDVEEDSEVSSSEESEVQETEAPKEGAPKKTAEKA